MEVRRWTLSYRLPRPAVAKLSLACAVGRGSVNIMPLRTWRATSVEDSHRHVAGSECSALHEPHLLADIPSDSEPQLKRESECSGVSAVFMGISELASCKLRQSECRAALESRESLYKFKLKPPARGPGQAP